jgi:predicted dehydrogenase
MGKVRVGFVGVGGMGQMAHLSNYAVLNNECQVVALAEPRPKLAKLISERYGIPQVYSSHEELLAKADVEAIVAAQPYRRHAILIPDILNKKIPVFTEKPLCLSVEAGEKLVEIGEKNNTLHMVGYHKRSDPAMEYAKKLIAELKASNELGKMRLVRVTMPPGDWIGGADQPLGTDEKYPEGAWEPYSASMTEAVNKQYDAFVNYYIHQVNAIRFLLGESYKVKFAEKSQVLLVGESASGVCCTLEMAPYSTTVDWQETMLVAFEKGFVKIDLPAPLVRQLPGRVTVMRDDGKSPPTTVQPTLPLRSAMRSQAINFLAAVRGERPAPCVAKDALEDLKVARDYIKLVFG